MRDTISPYNAKASPKMRIKIIPTKILSCCALALTPASPTIPIARPAARELKPQQSPDARWAYALLAVYLSSTRIKTRITFLNNNDSHNHSIDTQDTSHDDWYN